MSKIEEVARALYERAGEPRPGAAPLVAWDALEPKYREYWHGSARAALLAIREPTEGMLTAGDEARAARLQVRVNTIATWEAMIDHALTQETSE